MKLQAISYNRHTCNIPFYFSDWSSMGCLDYRFGTGGNYIHSLRE